MGFNSNRAILNSKTLPTSGKRKLATSNKELTPEKNGFDHIPRDEQKQKQKNLCKNRSNASHHRYNVSSMGSKSRGNVSDSSLSRSLEKGKSWTLKYGKDTKNSVRLNRMTDSEFACRTNRSPYVGSPSSKMDARNEKTEEVCRKDDSDARHSPAPSPSPSPSDSSKPVNVHSSPSSASFSSRESPTSVLWKRDRGSPSVKSKYVKAPSNLENGNISKDKSGVSQDSKNRRSPSSKAKSCQRGENVYSFGNIYRGLKNAVVKADSCQTHQNDTTARSKGSAFGKGNDSLSVHSKGHVLGFGGCNYGHGNIINGAMNAETGTGTKCLIIASNKREDQHTCPAAGMIPESKHVEELRNAGNEEYMKGHYAEAISLYDQALSLCPRDAPCHNNKATAMASLGRCAEAVTECLDAIECDPSYSPAHYRIGCLYTRLGRVEDAKWHFKLCGQQHDSEAMHTLSHVESHLLNMTKARNIEDWNRVLAECTWAIDAGANASDQVLAYKAEALLKLHRAKDALELLMQSKKSEIDKSKRPHAGDSCLLIIEAQVHMHLGRFDDGVIAAERAANLDPRPELLTWLRKVRAVAEARERGNELFKAANYLEACVAYGQGLEHDPTNSILLCNRAACRSLLRQWKMAVEDCNSALRSRPDYTKARLRRAHANAKLERWEESFRDYKILSREMSGDLNIAHSLLQVQAELKRFQGEPGSSPLQGQVTEVNSYTQFLKIVKLAGLVLLLFFMKSDEKCKQLSPLVTELSLQYPSWNFLKVDIEEHPDWAESESIEIVPIFFIYKNGLKLREICKPNRQILEHALKLHSS
ncbi:hypothetical protein ACLOJK_030153 [Asimina triloba]